jgi:prophage regulatory protein
VAGRKPARGIGRRRRRLAAAACSAHRITTVHRRLARSRLVARDGTKGLPNLFNWSHPLHSDDHRYLRLPEVRARYGCSRATIYAWIARGDFPPPVKLGRRLAAWRTDDLETWESTRRASEPTRRVRGPAILDLGLR